MDNVIRWSIIGCDDVVETKKWTDILAYSSNFRFTGTLKIKKSDANRHLTRYFNGGR